MIKGIWKKFNNHPLTGSINMRMYYLHVNWFYEMCQLKSFPTFPTIDGILNDVERLGTASRIQISRFQSYTFKSKSKAEIIKCRNRAMLKPLTFFLQSLSFWNARQKVHIRSKLPRGMCVSKLLWFDSGQKVFS